MKLNKKIFSIILITAVILSSFTDMGRVSAHENQNSVDGEPLYAISAVLMDGESGRILFEKNGFEKRPMASTTKIMTLIVALENSEADEVVTVSDYASKMPDVQLNINAGEQYRLWDLYYSLMLESHNDTACAIAEHIGGDVEGFADLMNQKAEEIGLSDTYFITPNGLDAADDKGIHSTTAAELAAIMKYCIMDSPKKDEFLEITQTKTYSFTDLSGERSFTVSNKNRLLDMMEGAISGKTGFTCDAGYCYVGAVQRDGRTFIVALLACGWPNNKNYKWSDAEKLIQYGTDNYNIKNIIDSAYETGEIEIMSGIGTDRLDTYTDYELSLLVRNDEEIKITKNLPEGLEAPVRKGERVGSLEIEINGHPYAECGIYAASDIERIDFMYCLKMCISGYLLTE